MDTPRSFRLTLVPAALALCLAPAAAAPPVLRMVALTGQPAPGTAPGTRFSLFGPAEFDGAPRLGADSTFAFGALLSDGTAGFWLDRGQGPALLAHSGEHAPGTDPGVLFSQRVSEAFLLTPPFLTPGHTVLFNTL